MENFSVDFLPILEQIEKDKGIPKDSLIKMIEHALISTYKRHNPSVTNVQAHINLNTGQITLTTKKNVVKKVTNPEIEISLTEAKMDNPKIKVGEEVDFKIDTSKFGRIAAQTTKQVLIQKIRETEKENIYNEYKAKEGNIVSGYISKMVNNTAIFEIGKMEGILPVREQVEKETYTQGLYMKVYIAKVENDSKGPKIIVSRRHPDLLTKLFELEVPEIYDGTIEVKTIARDAGNRSKVAVYSKNPKVDPVGSVVGVRGARIRAIIEELGGEKIDLVIYSDDAKQYIENALKPAEIAQIILDEKNKNADVIVATDQLSLAIGKGGNNVKLAARLTGWHLNIKNAEQLKEAKIEKTEAELAELGNIDGINKKIAAILISTGYFNILELKKATKEDLMGLQGIGEKTAEKILESVKKL